MLEIKIASTYFELPCDPNGFVVPGVFNIKDHWHILTQRTYNSRFRRMVVVFRYMMYSKDRGTVRIPKYFLREFQNRLSAANVDTFITPIEATPGQPIDLQMSDWFEYRDNQVPAIDFLADTKDTMRALAAQTGCITGDTNIRFNRAGKGFSQTIASAYGSLHGNMRGWDKTIPTKIRAYNGTSIQLHELEDIVYSGKKVVFKLTLENGYSIKATANHEIMTSDGFVPLCNLTSHAVMIDVPRPINLTALSHGEHQRLHAIENRFNFNQGIPKYSRVVSIEELGIEDTYDIICKDPYRNFVANDIVIHNSGKTSMAIAAAQKLGLTTMILTQGLVDQWVSEVSKFTKVREGEVHVIQGHKSLGLLQKKTPWPTPKFYVASLGTMRKYVEKITYPYTDFMPIDEFFTHLGIGTKIVDEAHLNFITNTMIDLSVDVANNIYLSATYNRSDRDGERIFDTVFPKAIRFGEDAYDKYVSIYAYTYNIGTIPERKVMTPQGYNQAKFEKYLLSRKTTLLAYFDKIAPLIESHYMNKKRSGQKLLILVGIRKMAEALLNYINKRYAQHGWDTSIYMAETSDEVLENSDVIISTIGSCGTGRDIKDLRTVIVTNSLGSLAINKQTLGRLRKLKSGDTPEFVYLINNGIRSQIDHGNFRANLFRSLGLTFSEMFI